MPPDEAHIYTSSTTSRPPFIHWVCAGVLAFLIAVFIGYVLFHTPPHSDFDFDQPVSYATVNSPVPVPPSIPVPPIGPNTLGNSRATLAELDAHLLLYLPFSSSLEDHSSYHLAGTVNGSIQVSEGSAHFPGDAYIAFPHISLENRPFAFSVWIKPEGQVSGYGLLEQVDAGPGKHLHILMRDPDRPYLGFYLNDLRATQSIKGGKGWTHLTFQYTGSLQQIFIDGKLDVERVSDSFHGEHGETRIGKAPMWNNVPTQCFFGAMRDLRLYDTALTPEQIRQIYDLNWTAPAPPNEASPAIENKKPEEF